MEDRIFVRVVSEVVPFDTQLARLSGKERISSLFEFELLVVCPPETSIQPGAAIGQPLTLVFERGQPGQEQIELRRVHGLIAQIVSAKHGGQNAYRLKLVPRAWYSTLVETVDVHMDSNVLGIIDRRLRHIQLEPEIDFELRVVHQYPDSEFVVQFKERDLDFVSRLAEHWGVSYFFEHGEDTERMIFTDFNGGFTAAAEPLVVPFVERAQDLGVYTIELTTKIVPRLFVQRDYNYRTPAMDLTGKAEASHGVGGIVEYGGHFKTSVEAERFANLRREEHHCQHEIYRGQSSLPVLGAGGTVRVEQPDEPLTLLITEIEHEFVQVVFDGGGKPEAYCCSFQAIDQRVAYRPPRVHKKPRVDGMLTGIVESGSGTEYADVDELGRYRVRFLFDTSEAGEAQASRPVRMMQPHAGANFGVHFPLRSGTEVLITFVDGDPDRPIIAGSVPNPQTPSPVTSDNRERNVIRTGGGNEIDMDDTNGSTRIKMTVPHSNTIFQLGAPNAPEAGAIFQTTGAFSSLSGAGFSTISSFRAMLDVYQNYRASGDIVNVASPPGKKWLLFLGIVQTAIGEAQTVINLIEQGMAFHEKIKKEDAMRQQEAVRSEVDKCKDCRAELAALEADLPASVQQASEDYRASLDTRDEMYFASLEARRLRDLAIERNMGDTVDQDVYVNEHQQTLKQAEYDRQTAALDAYDDPKTLAAQLEAAEDCFEKHCGSNPSAGTPAAAALKALQDAKDAENTGDLVAVQDKLKEFREQLALCGLSEKAVDEIDGNVTKAEQKAALPASATPVAERREALTSALTAAENDTSLTAVEKAALSSYRKKLAECSKSCNADNLKAARDKAARAVDDYWKVRSDAHSEHYKNMSRAKAVLSVAATIPTLISGIMALYSLLQKSKHLVYLNTRWTFATNAKRLSNRLPLWLGAYPLADSPSHVLGADHSTEIYGKETMLLWSPMLTLHGIGAIPKSKTGAPDPSKGKLHLLAEQEIWMASPKETYVSAGETLKLASPKVVIEAKDPLATKGELEVTSVKGTTVTSEQDSIELKAPLKAIHLEAKTEATVKADKIELSTTDGSGVLKLENGKALDIVVGDFTIKISGASVEIKPTTGGVSAPKISMTKDKVICQHGQNAILKLESGGPTLQCGMSQKLQATTAGFKVNGSRIQLG